MAIHVVPQNPPPGGMIAEKALGHQALRWENLYLKRELESLQGSNRLVGRSPRMQEVLALIQRVAPTDSTVLIYGESGTGKELVARAIHNNSQRKGQRFVAVDCSTLSETLLESELFGHVRGAFTGATVTKPGLFEVADGGSFFLDEVGQIPPTIQGKLLRVLQEREILPIGATRPRKVDVRIVAASHPDLEECMSKGRFREDLYYRLHIFPIHLPPLRERREDIPLLAQCFLVRHSQWVGARPRIIHRGAMEKLFRNDWPGNVRELENTLERAAILADGGEIRPEHLLLSEDPRSGLGQLPIPRCNEDLKVLRRKVKEQATQMVERSFVMGALRRNEWNVSRAARDVGLKRQNFQALMRKFGIRK